MASREVVLASDALRRRGLYLSPLDKVQRFFEALSELRQATADDSPDDKTRFASPWQCVSLRWRFRDAPSNTLCMVYTRSYWF